MNLENIMVLLLDCPSLQQLHYIVHVLIQHHVECAIMFCVCGEREHLVTWWQCTIFRLVFPLSLSLTPLFPLHTWTCHSCISSVRTLLTAHRSSCPSSVPPPSLQQCRSSSKWWESLGRAPQGSYHFQQAAGRKNKTSFVNFHPLLNLYTSFLWRLMSSTNRQMCIKIIKYIQNDISLWYETKQVRAVETIDLYYTIEGGWSLLYCLRSHKL